MTLTEQYSEKIQAIMKPLQGRADYWDIRFGESSGTRISYRSKVLEELTFPKGFGGSVRMLVKGGWGFVTFRDLNELEDSARQALRFAALVGKRTSKLAEIKPEKDIVLGAEEKKDFLLVDTKQKIVLLDSYRDCVWENNTNLVQSTLIYMDSMSRKLFISSEGSEIEQEFPRVRCILQVVAKNDGVVQKYYENLGFNNFADLRGREADIKQAVETVNLLIKAPAAKGGVCPVVMDGKLAGTFAHEAFGHLSEADNVESDDQLKKIMEIGRTFGNEKITIYDDPNSGSWGSYKYDDEGVKGEMVMLLDKGVLAGRMQNRQTAAILNEKPNGHGRAGGVTERPLVRMGTTVIASGNSEEKDLFSGIEKGYYCVSWQAGMTDHENFTFAASYGYEINNGKLGQMVRDIKISGNLFETLKTVEGVGKESVEEPGTCGKMGQYLSVGTIAPAVRLGKVLVMGV